MKLAHYQIEHIKEYIDRQNIWYDDIKDELLDHLICAVEAEMETNEIKFIDALGKVLTEVNPNELQRQKLKVEHIQTFKDLASELKAFVSTKKVIFTLAATTISYSVIRFSVDLEEAMKVFQPAMILALMLSFAIPTVSNRALRPLKNAYFISRLNTIYTSAFLASSIINLLALDWLIAHPKALIIYITIFICFVIAGFLLMNKTMLKLKARVA
ncbi:hypothetical protein [Roseivirga pacifica]|uniref:hypothetical protein n=1 Tax=Roseivirga pacifica TaxID=1267423 RepID=UPI0020965194|nr:hypothetical protein [Roseivirga pacifica]MCO6361036.1 hypothetical protein [Roseivirga pacifica]MCO6368925.1 hypothetical protein [Roseivirga pacifica]MCO6373068.1 hypothetical protein [Roseivirga pacifica]MCO6373148.1 hypothetical protein [Roseivirga pacifica]MCO6377595.1 hypothetical protein [Roseivirga pacifica]